jgi:secernin
VAATKAWGEIDDDVLSKLFECLRQTDDGEGVKTSQVSILPSSGLCNHWFTATPQPAESVFKPFVFTPNARISPLTKAANVGEQTVLTKLHAARNWAGVGDLLKSLESSCVDEVKTYLLDHSDAAPTQELDELMKDCVEAEVKFYRN